ncbi:FAD dependent oxidoreductase [Lophiotrema nucula]|uniref:FAD dependent oxidoreductase n=1 Tax=Lophiotrema nucula TaxID=690887 RepID=A0A6A5ZQZ7_9PLEO|nr:FAD dependent oxidoreductase [Lophiotrema nucula]
MLSPVLIVGAGTWGCSIALHLARRGYTSITVLDSSPVPSPTSAGNDLNKIAEEAREPKDEDSDEDYFWNKTTQIAMKAWKEDPLFSPLYHPMGFIMAAVGDEAYEKCIAYAESEGILLTPLKSKEDFQTTMPKGVLTGDFPGWRGFWKKSGAGWVSASATLRAMHDEASNLGVQFITGSPVTSLIYSSSRDSILGARTADDKDHLAGITILSAGAGSDALLDFKKQLRPTAWTLAHLPLTPSEAKLYLNLPVLYGVDRGFFIEPSHSPGSAHELKICDEHPGYINPILSPSSGEVIGSRPFAKEQVPLSSSSRIRSLLSETMPHLAGREFSFARICWDADTIDRTFLIDKHPELNGLVVVVGGSGNGFATAPAIGVVVADLIEDKLDSRLKKAMRWRPEIAEERDWWDTQDRFGGEGKVMDFRDVREWTSIGEDESKETET